MTLGFSEAQLPIDPLGGTQTFEGVLGSIVRETATDPLAPIRRVYHHLLEKSVACDINKAPKIAHMLILDKGSKPAPLARIY